MEKIFSNEPENWVELQEMVGEVFKGIGFSVEIEKDIQTVRGGVNVDVYAELLSEIKEVCICECKYWNKPVSKHVIHSFRTVISDYGANFGYIISKKGFQKGAYEAALNSNIKLLSFDEFQNTFKYRWLNGVVAELDTIGYPLRKFTDYLESFYDKELELLPEDKKRVFSDLLRKYSSIAPASNRHYYKSMLTGKIEKEYVEWGVSSNLKAFPIEIKVECLNDYFSYLIETCKKGVKEFDDLFGKKVRKR